MNPYLQIIEQSEKEDAEAWARIDARDNWYDNPLRFVDVEDLFHEDGLMRSRRGILAIAGEHFRSNRDGAGAGEILTESLYGTLPGTKDIQKHVLKNMLRDALSAFSKKATKAQVEAIVLEREAIEIGKTPSNHIAEARGTTVQAALRLLKRAQEAILVQNEPSNAIIKVNADIKLRASGLPRVCAVCGNVCEDSLKALCKVCHMRHVYNDEYLSDYHRHDVENSMRLSSVNHWKKARDLVME